MQATNIFLLLIGIGLFGFYLVRGRSLAIANPLGGIRRLHSLPSYYGMHAALWCALPPLLILGFWLMFDEPVINSIVMNSLPSDLHQLIPLAITYYSIEWLILPMAFYRVKAKRSV